MQKNHSSQLKTKAAILESAGSPLILAEITIPPLLPGQILVKVKFSGVCRSQLMEVRGKRGPDKWVPHLLGHEGSGEVYKVGPGVTKVVPGDDVVLGWLKAAGMDAPGAKYKLDNQVINSGPVTTFSEYTIVSENRVVKKPKGLGLDVSVLFGCALLTGAGMVFNELKPSPQNSVVVMGLGGIGLAALMALVARGCTDIIAIDVSEEKLAFARELGVRKVLNANSNELISQFSKLVPGGADYCIESAGTVKSIELGYDLIRPNGGKLLFASHPPEGEKISLNPHDLIKGKLIAGSWGGDSNPDRDIPIFSKIFQETNTPISRLITRRYKLEDINNALNDLEAGIVFRPLIVMGH